MPMTTKQQLDIAFLYVKAKEEQGARQYFATLELTPQQIERVCIALMGAITINKPDLAAEDMRRRRWYENRGLLRYEDLLEQEERQQEYRAILDMLTAQLQTDKMHHTRAYIEALREL